MDAGELERFLLSFQGASRDFPFGEEIAVFRVGGKMFALLFKDESLNLKADPLDVKAYQELFTWVHPGYHMNKKHWITILLSQVSEKELLKTMIRESYALVFAKLTRSARAKIEALCPALTPS